MAKKKKEDPKFLKLKTLDEIGKDLLERKCFKATELVSKMRSVAEVLTSVDFGLKTDVITFKDDKRVFIPTGTKDKPAGLTSTEAEIICFVEHTSRTDDFPHSFMRCVSTKSLKEFMKENWGLLEKGVDKDFKTSGVYIMLSFLDEVTITEKK